MSEELLAVLLLLVVAPLLAALMLLGWRRRAARQQGIPRPAQPVGDPSTGAVRGTYVSTTTAGDWLDRVVAHGLGTRSEVLVDVDDGGVSLHRTGARSVLVPAADLVGVRRERGMAGKFVDRNGLVVLTWRLGGVELDTGVRARVDAEADGLVAAVDGLVEGTPR